MRSTMLLKWFWISLCLNLCQTGRPRQKRFLSGQSGCETLTKCPGAVNVIIPYRLNFNPITAYDRITSHVQGRYGWSRDEMRNFERQRNSIIRMKRRKGIRRELHRRKVRLWRKEPCIEQEKCLYGHSYFVNAANF